MPALLEFDGVDHPVAQASWVYVSGVHIITGKEGRHPCLRVPGVHIIIGNYHARKLKKLHGNFGCGAAYLAVGGNGEEPDEALVPSAGVCGVFGLNHGLRTPSLPRG